MWTHFMDMHSGGGTKVKPYEHIFIEAREAEARAIFFNRFGRNPDCVTCTCCGNDYSVTEHRSLNQATGYERNCEYENGKYVERQRKSSMRIRSQCNTKADDPWGLYMTVADYKKRDDVLIIPKTKIKAKERAADIPQQGYVWAD